MKTASWAGWGAAVALAVVGFAAQRACAQSPAADALLELVPTEPDFFHPDRQPGAGGSRPPMAQPAWGGRVIVRLSELPRSLNYVIENSAIARRILYEVHETLALRNPETLALEPDLAASWEQEDTLYTRPPDGGKSPSLYGKIETKPEGLLVTPISPGNPLGGPLVVPNDQVVRVERGTVLTFHLRPGVKWHDGEPFDARDVLFSWSLYKNPHVPCDDKRFQFEKVREATILDPLTVRFVFDQAYFNALANLADMCILPAHLYDLSHPDNPRFDPQYHAEKRAAAAGWKPSAEEQAQYVVTNPHNRSWVGLGPYRVTDWNDDWVEAARFDGYFDPKRGGYLDTLRWRLIASDNSAFQALLNGEIDFDAQLRAEDYFGPSTETEAFKSRFYKGYVYGGTYGYIAWNLTRPKFADERVRRALAMCFPAEEFRQGFYRGQALQVTGSQSIFAPGYDRSVKPLPFDPAAARQLFAEAGWYDRDGDGLIDKDGQPFAFEFSIQTGGRTGEAVALRLQEELAKVGVKMSIAQYDSAVFTERCQTREFDAVARAWVPPPEIDPEQVWHSKWAGPGVRGSNYCGFADPQVDALIERGQKELDPERRYAIWRELHAYVYARQPYLFLFNPARKFALVKTIRGFQALRIDPNYALRRWYHPAGTEGTRSTPR